MFTESLDSAILAMKTAKNRPRRYGAEPCSNCPMGGGEETFKIRVGTTHRSMAAIACAGFRRNVFQLCDSGPPRAMHFETVDWATSKPSITGVVPILAVDPLPKSYDRWHSADTKPTVASAAGDHGELIESSLGLFFSNETPELKTVCVDCLLNHRPR